MSQVKKLEELLKKLEKSREQLKKNAEGGFLGIGHQRRTGGNFDGVVGGKKKVSVPKCSCNGGAFLGTKADKVGDNSGVRGGAYIDKDGNLAHGTRQISSRGPQRSVKGGYLSGGYLSGGRTSGGARKPNKWIQHVKAYAKKHNISYAEAITQAKSSYNP